jgi:hypothetical protein
MCGHHTLWTFQKLFLEHQAFTLQAFPWFVAKWGFFPLLKSSLCSQDGVHLVPRVGDCLIQCSACLWGPSLLSRVLAITGTRCPGLLAVSFWRWLN